MPVRRGRCGPLNEDFETERGWTINPGGSDTATSGRFQRDIPASTSDGGGVKQLDYGFSGQAALVTGARQGSSPGANDLDGGSTSALSPAVTLGTAGGSGWRLQFRYAFAHDSSGTQDDYVRVLVNGSVVFVDRGQPVNRNATWQLVDVSLAAFAGQQVQVRVEANDGASASLVEVAVDDVRIFRGR